MNDNADSTKRQHRRRSWPTILVTALLVFFATLLVALIFDRDCCCCGSSNSIIEKIIDNDHVNDQLSIEKPEATAKIIEKPIYKVIEKPVIKKETQIVYRDREKPIYLGCDENTINNFRDDGGGSAIRKINKVPLPSTALLMGSMLIVLLIKRGSVSHRV